MVLNIFVRTEPEQLRDDFLSIASHELRTPLAVLKLQTQYLHRRLATQGLYDDVAILTTMEAQIQKLERLNGALLNVSKIQAGRLEYVEGRVDLNQLLRECAGVMHQIHPTYTIVVRGAAPTSVLGDAGRRGQVFSNWLSNAIKYSPQAATGDVAVGASAE